ncbi:hypothetical protein GPJ56_007760 [Histomonas meleagridis]|uniref:uncharacterized protein n=1 Tax=Histomonas meleagridis TaxID=135588 RepID=UPI0035598BFA|nr:hypothetical protein GPJ56_007760 [Histomonas meleagridis]KAH0798761.1 hypothetical protein GO595_008626 [Histomonas meleagridis]
MQLIDFPVFLSYRYRACVHVSFSQSALSMYPDSPQVLTNTWYQLESKNTCPFKYRLEFDEPDLTPEYVFQQIENEAAQFGEPSKSASRQELPWFRYWAELPFREDKYSPFSFADIPVCYIYVSTIPEQYQPHCPEWMLPHIKDVPIFNLVISPDLQSASRCFIVRESSETAFFDFVLKITHYEAAPRLTSLREITEHYVNTNFQGIRNSVLRFIGWNGSKRSDVFIQLKKLGDLCVSTGLYENAIKYYNMLYRELTPEHELNASTTFMLGVASTIFPNADIDVTELLKPIINDKTVDLLLRTECGFLASYNSTICNQMNRATSLYMRTFQCIKQGKFPFSFIVYPMISEALSTINSPHKAALFLFRAADSYKKYKLVKNSLICLWKSYNLLHLTGWPKLEHALLLKISMIGTVPPQLSYHIAQRNISYVVETVEQLKKIKVENTVFINSVIVHDINKQPTGFPESPPPGIMSTKYWSSIRKKLFPVVYHPSTEEFATSMWTEETATTNYKIAIDEINSIKFKLSPANLLGCQMQNVKLFIEPEDKVLPDVIDVVNLRSTIQLEAKFKAVKQGSFYIKGIKFMWFGVAPGAVLFSPIKYEAVGNKVDSKVEIINKPEISYVGIPLRFSVKLSLEGYSQHNASHISIECQTANVTLISPKLKGFLQRYTIENLNDLHEFEAVPTAAGQLTVNVFLTFTDETKNQRFAFDYFSIDCKEIQKPKITSDCSSLHVMTNSDISDISSECAKLHLEDNQIIFDDINPNYQKKQCFVSISRNLTGTIVTNEIEIQELFVKFDNLYFENLKSPSVVSIPMHLICLGKNEGELILKDPISSEFIWIWKTKYKLEGPKIYDICPKLLLSKPFKGKISDLIKVQYGKTKANFSNLNLVLE